MTTQDMSQDEPDEDGVIDDALVVRREPVIGPDPEYTALYRRLRAEGGVDLHEQLHARYLDLQRGGTTPGGLPYPSPTDPVAEGADAIRALAEAVDAGLPSAWIAYTPTIVGVMTPSVVGAAYRFTRTAIEVQFHIALDVSSSTSASYLTMTFPLSVPSVNLPAGYSGIGVAVWSDAGIGKSLTIIRASVTSFGFNAGAGDVAASNRRLYGSDLAAGDSLSGTLSIRI